MRELKFKAYHKEHGMCTVQSLDYSGDRLCWVTLAKNGYMVVDEDDNDIRFVIEEVDIVQFTGLTDKRGVEIYEGDIVVCLNSKPSEIKFIDGCFFFMDLLTRDGKVDLYLWKRCLEGQGEVIGNIWENPELLKT